MTFFVFLMRKMRCSYYCSPVYNVTFSLCLLLRLSIIGSQKFDYDGPWVCGFVFLIKSGNTLAITPSVIFFVI